VGARRHSRLSSRNPGSHRLAFLPLHYAEMNIRTIEISDRVGIAKAFCRTFTAPPWNEAWSEQSALTVIDEWLPSPQFFGLVAIDEGFVQGFVFGRRETWDQTKLFYVKELCVVPEHQRKGLGKRLTSSLEDLLRSEGVSMLYLHTMRDSPAAGFYDAQQYRASQRMVMFSKRLIKVATSR
jgi:aminoglycoside 6'-N-acetyltransferase I